MRGNLPRVANNASALTKLLAKSTPSVAKGGRGKKKVESEIVPKRIDIVSERLCDDVIKYLSPTLEKHKGCTLIDLQPGACLFSSKLHNFLKPKWHLLMEPEMHYYKPFIKPLLEKPGSTYRYTRLNIEHAESYPDEFRRILNDPSLLPTRPTIPDDDPKLQELDHSMLIVGNLARRPRTRTSVHMVDQAPLTLHRMANYALDHSHFQGTGLVRMLMWVPEEYKPSIIGNLPWTRSPLSVGLDMGVSITEAVSVTPLESIRNTRMYKRRRSELYDYINGQDVEERMKSAQIVVPEKRHLQKPKQKVRELAKGDSPVSPLSIDVTSVSEMQASIDETSLRVVDITAKLHRRRKPDLQSLLDSLEFPQATVVTEEYLQHLPGYQYDPERIIVFLDLRLRLIHVEANFKDLEENCTDKAAIEALRASISRLEQEISEVCDQSAKVIAILENLLEDQIAFYTSPPLLTYYRRAYEPLQAASSDFWPPLTDLALFDMTPKGRDLSVPGLADAKEATKLCTLLLQTLFGQTRHPVTMALDRLGINAAKDLIPMVPAITDPRRGGRLDARNLKVRMLTEEMLEGLVKAFFEWPFRPQAWEVALSNRSLPAPEAADAEEAAG